MKWRLIAKATLWIPILRHRGTARFCFAAPKSGAVFLMLLCCLVVESVESQIIPASSLGQLVFNYQLIVSSPSACQQSCQDSRLWSIGRRHGAAWGFPSTSHKTDFAPEATWWLGLPKSSEKHVGCLVCSMLGWFQWMSQTKVLVMKIKTLPTVTANGKLSCWWQPHLLITAFWVWGPPSKLPGLSYMLAAFTLRAIRSIQVHNSKV